MLIAKMAQLYFSVSITYITSCYLLGMTHYYKFNVIKEYSNVKSMIWTLVGLNLSLSKYRLREFLCFGTFPTNLTPFLNKMFFKKGKFVKVLLTAENP